MTTISVLQCIKACQNLAKPLNVRRHVSLEDVMRDLARYEELRCDATPHTCKKLFVELSHQRYLPVL